MIISDNDVEKALDYLKKTDEEAAKAKALLHGLEEKENHYRSRVH